MFEDLDFAQSANVMTRQIQRRRINVDDFPPTEKWPNLTRLGETHYYYRSILVVVGCVLSI